MSCFFFEFGEQLTPFFCLAFLGFPGATDSFRFLGSCREDWQFSPFLRALAFGEELTAFLFRGTGTGFSFETLKGFSPIA